MSEEDLAHIEPVPDVEEEKTSYKPPAEKSLNEMLEADQEDESLRKYKAALLGSATDGAIVIDSSNPKTVIVRKLTLVVDGNDYKDLDLTGDLNKLKQSNIIIKEGVQYKIRIDFHVQREIVTGLRYVQGTYRKGILVDKLNQMVGSYAPKEEIQSYTTPIDEAPSGLLSRATYTVKSTFKDDDDNEYLKWEWSFVIKKDWE